MADPSFLLVKALYPFDGADAATTFVDASGTTTATAVNGAALSAAQSRWGATSLFLDRTTTDYVYLSSTPAIGTADYTIECWIRPTNYADGGNRYIVDFNATGVDGDAPSIFMDNAGTLFWRIGGTTRVISSAGVVAEDVWAHVALTRASGISRVYYAGNQIGADYDDGILNIAANTDKPRIGLDSRFSANKFEGYISDFRLTIGEARYTGATLTVPTEAFSTSLNAEGLVTETATIVQTASGNYARTQVSAAVASSAMAHKYAVEFSEVLAAVTSWQTFRQLGVEASTIAGAADGSKLKIATEVAESATIAAADLPVLVMELLSQIRGSASMETYFSAVALLMDGVTASAEGLAASSTLLSDTASTLTSLEAISRFVAEALDAAVATSAATTGLTITVFESAAASATDGIQTWTQHFAELLESGRATVSLTFPDGGHVTWVMNTEGAMPVSEYDNFEFNSFAELGRDIYAAGASGLYRLGGDTDAGTAIDASILSLMEDFSTSKQKRVRSAYLGYTTDGALILKVKAVQGGQLTEHWFKAEARTADAPTESRVTLAMGIRSRYWQFELVNVDGADFEIEELELHPLVLSRRV